MLTRLGVFTIAAVMVLILFRLTSVLVALTLVPLAAAVIGGAGSQAGAFAMEGIRAVTPVAVLLAFAVVYFGVMSDAGLFDPVVRTVTRIVGRDPVRISVGAAAVATISHLDGAGASTFMVTIPAMLPLYRAARMDPLALTCVVALAAGTMNMLPWGGPTSRAAASLHAAASTLFVPLVPAMLAGLAGVFVLAARIGLRERARLARADASRDEAGAADDVPIPPAAPASAAGGGWRWRFNAALTAVTLVALFVEVLPLPVVFPVGSALALLVNLPEPASAAGAPHRARQRGDADGHHGVCRGGPDRRPHELWDARRHRGGPGAGAAGHRVPSSAGGDGRRVGAAEPGVRPRLVLLRRAAGAGHRVRGGGRIGGGSRAGRDTRSDDEPDFRSARSRRQRFCSSGWRV